jgi:hypothetical protein
VIYKDANVTVTAFATKHAIESHGYRFDTPDRSIVISGGRDSEPNAANRRRPQQVRELADSAEGGPLAAMQMALGSGMRSGSPRSSSGAGAGIRPEDTT